VEIMRGPAANAHGVIGNRNVVDDADTQRPALCTLVAGAALGRRDWVEEAWRVVEVTFAHTDRAGRLPGGPNGNALFLSRFALALGVLEASPLATEYAPRIARLEPNLQRAARALAVNARAAPPRKRDYLYRTLIGASVLVAFGERYRDERLRSEGLVMADRALGMQREDGGFVHNDEVRLVVQGFYVDALHALMSYVPEQRYRDAARRAGALLQARVLPSGAVDRTGDPDFEACKMGVRQGCPNTMSWYLGLHGARFDADAFDASARSLQYYSREARRTRARAQP